MRQQLWRQLLTFERLLVPASSIAADQTLSTQPTAGARALCRSSFQHLQAAEALPPWMLSGFAYSRYFVARSNRSGKAASKANSEEPDEKPEPDKKGPRVNRAVTDRFIQIVTEEGHQVMTRQAALEFAQRSGLDLVEELGIRVSASGHVVTCSKPRVFTELSYLLSSKQHASEDPQTSNKVSEEAVSGDGEEVVEDPKETRPGWLLKVIVALTMSYMAFHGFPMIGESSIRHSLALLRAEDPLFKRSGASRLALFAKNDDKRRNVVKAGGIERLMSMLEGASDDQTRCEAIKALVSLAHCEEAVLALHEVRADVVFQALLRSSSDPDILKYSSVVLEKLDKGNCSSLGED